MSEERKKSKMPFDAPRSVAPIYTPPPATVQNPKTPSRRKQLKQAKKTHKAPISVRNLFTGLFLLLGTGIAVTFVISPSIITSITSGEFIKSSETCKVTETNSSMFFDTTCGKFEWNSERQPGKPQNKLEEGMTYRFDSVGARIEPAQVFPSVTSYKEVKVSKEKK